MTKLARLSVLLLPWLILPSSLAAAPDDVLARDLLAELIEINTAPSGGNDIRPAVDLLVERLRTAGFPEDTIHVVAKEAHLPNLVVRYPARNPRKKPLLMMAHLDVVEAHAEDWTVDPFTFTEIDGYYYGRGATDNKAGAAMLIANLIQFRKEGLQPNRDLIVMLTADEETTGEGAEWLSTEYRSLIDAEFALNTDGGLVMLRSGQPGAFIMQTSEKVYAVFEFEATDPGGHSSLPRPESAISRLAGSLVDLNRYRFPVDLNETTRAFFTSWQHLAPENEQALIGNLLASPQSEQLHQRLAESQYYNALARTTCVATMLQAGHAENALPQRAGATVNCRILPHQTVEDIRQTLESIARPHGVRVTQIGAVRPSPPSPLADDVVQPVSAVAGEMWPGIPVIPEMSTGATDGLFLRNVGIPVYGVSAIAEDPDDIRAHGQDERIRVESFEAATRYWYRLVRHMATN